MRSRPGLVVLPLLVLCAVQAGSSGCSSRVETAVAEADSTWSYASRKGDGPDVSITLCRKISSRTAKPIGAGQVFTLRPGAKVRALVEIENADALGTDRELMLHLVWVDPDGAEFYMKRVDVVPDGGEARAVGTISIPPARREPGPYMLRVYLFRELVAEKRFELRSPPAGSG